MLRLDAFGREEFLAGIERFRGMRWVTVLRVDRAPGRRSERVAGRVGPAAALPSRSAYASCPRSRSSVAVTAARPGSTSRTRRCGLGVEYDGAEWHSSPSSWRTTGRAATTSPTTAGSSGRCGAATSSVATGRASRCIRPGCRRGPRWPPPVSPTSTADAPTRAPAKTRRLGAVRRARRADSGQKMMSPDLRRERSSWRASSRMSSASLSERRSFT